MDYHGRIMNIAARHPKTADVMTAHETTVYKYGHRDARHAAAEIACEADALIANLSYELGSEKTYVDQLQRALNRWLPMVDEVALGEDAANAAGDDAYLLCGLMDVSGREFGKEIIAAKDAEIARLTGCLERANAQAERFEREWYLRGDVIEQCIPALEIGREAAHVISVLGDDRGVTIRDALTAARAALAPAAEVSGG